MTEPTPEPVWGGPPPEPLVPEETGLPPAPVFPPPRPSAAAPWGIAATVGWTILIGIAFVAAAFISIPVFGLVSPGIRNPSELMVNGDFFTINALITLVTAGSAVLLAVLLRRGISPGDYLGFKAAPVRSYGFWLVALIGANLATEVVLRLLGVESMPSWMTDIGKDVTGPSAFFLAIVFAAPFTEELIFRGFIFAGLRPRLGPHLTVFFSVVPWALLHGQYQPIFIVAVLALGLVLGYAREKTGSIYVPLALHCLNNAFGYWQIMSA